MNQTADNIAAQTHAFFLVENDDAPTAQTAKERKPISRMLYDMVHMLDDHTCVYCGIRKPGQTLDHYIPASLGGPDVLQNLVVACLECNQQKKNYAPYEVGMVARYGRFAAVQPALAVPLAKTDTPHSPIPAMSKPVPLHLPAKTPPAPIHAEADKDLPTAIAIAIGDVDALQRWLPSQGFMRIEPKSTEIARFINPDKSLIRITPTGVWVAGKNRAAARDMLQAWERKQK